ncbi:MAG: hypothetical protein Q9P14_10310 [candidate division KSB1 bacterium]|nr:hypothetical protein [candidate division KSB1 bacterium]
MIRPLPKAPDRAVKITNDLAAVMPNHVLCPASVLSGMEAI